MNCSDQFNLSYLIIYDDYQFIIWQDRQELGTHEAHGGSAGKWACMHRAMTLSFVLVDPLGSGCKVYRRQSGFGVDVQTLQLACFSGQAWVGPASTAGKVPGCTRQAAVWLLLL